MMVVYVAITEIDGLDRFACEDRGAGDADWADDLDRRRWLKGYPATLEFVIT